MKRLKISDELLLCLAWFELGSLVFCFSVLVYLVSK